MNLTQAEYWATLLPGIIAFFSPAIASFLSREHVPSEVTAAITIAVTAGGAFLTQLLQDGTYSWTWATLKAFAAYVIAAEARSQFWQKTHTDAKLLAWPRKLPKSGEETSHFGGIPDDQVETPAA
jgi:hypothetical protein